MSMMVSFVLSFFPRDVLDEILNLIESVSEDFPSYSCQEQTSSRLLRYHGYDAWHPSGGRMGLAPHAHVYMPQMKS